MNLLRQFKTVLQNMKIADQEYGTLIHEIRNSNYTMMSIASTFAMISFLIIFVFSLCNPEINTSPALFVFLGYFLSCSIFLLINLLILRNRKKYVIFLMYAFMFFVFSYAYYIDIYRNRNQSSVIFCAIIFIVPSIFIDRFKRIHLFTILVTSFFILSSFMNKRPEIFIKDAVNGTVFVFIEAFFGNYFVYLRMRDFLILHTVSPEDYDELTDVLDRTAFEREITKHILISQKKGTVLLMDIKNFSMINGLYGRSLGDSILKQFSDQLKMIFKNNDVIGRYDGDSFCVFMPNITNIDVAKIRVQMLIEGLSENIRIPEGQYELSVNAGIAGCTRMDETTKSLLQKAEKALGDAKLKGMNKIAVFRETNQEKKW